MKALVIIPARGGSKGIPNKNIKLLHGKPLIQYSIEIARIIVKDKDICLTTDSESIKSVANSIGLDVPFLRPASLAQDHSSSYDVLLHAIEYYEQQGEHYDTIILLQPTSPLRSLEQVQEALELYDASLDMVVSVVETKSNPYYVLFEEDQEGFLQKSKEGEFVTRQSCPQVWEYNGAIYVINIASLKNSPIHEFKRIKKYVMDEESSVDLDTQLDWMLCEQIIQKRANKING